MAKEDTTEGLLREWFNWWQKTDIAPIKMPKALHTRTAIHLVELEEQERKRK